MVSEKTRIVEVGGVKMEVDLSTATIIENYHVGQYVKILIKDYNGYKSFVGHIIGFDNFKNLPTITVIYLDNTYSNSEIKFAYINANNNNETEICPLNNMEIPFSKSEVITRMQNEIDKKEREATELRAKLDLFLTTFNKYFENINK